jgi:hypothetical protein
VDSSWCLSSEVPGVSVVIRGKEKRRTGHSAPCKRRSRAHENKQRVAQRKNQRGTAPCSARKGKQRHAARIRSAPPTRQKKKRKEKKSGTAKAKNIGPGRHSARHRARKKTGARSQSKKVNPREVQLETSRINVGTGSQSDIEI